MSKKKSVINSDLPKLHQVAEEGIGLIPKFGLREPRSFSDKLGVGANSTSPILTQLNELAALAPSYPYSAVFLKGDTVYIAQSKGKEGEETRVINLDKLKENSAFKNLLKDLHVEKLKVEIKRYTPTGEHPDTIAIAEGIKSLINHEFEEIDKRELNAQQT